MLVRAAFSIAPFLVHVCTDSQLQLPSYQIYVSISHVDPITYEWTAYAVFVPAPRMLPSVPVVEVMLRLLKDVSERCVDRIKEVKRDGAICVI